MSPLILLLTLCCTTAAVQDNPEQKKYGESTTYSSQTDSNVDVENFVRRMHEIKLLELDDKCDLKHSIQECFTVINELMILFKANCSVETKNVPKKFNLKIENELFKFKESLRQHNDCATKNTTKIKHSHGSSKQCKRPVAKTVTRHLDRLCKAQGWKKRRDRKGRSKMKKTKIAGEDKEYLSELVNSWANDCTDPMAWECDKKLLEVGRIIGPKCKGHTFGHKIHRFKESSGDENQVSKAFDFAKFERRYIEKYDRVCGHSKKERCRHVRTVIRKFVKAGCKTFGTMIDKKWRSLDRGNERKNSKRPTRKEAMKKFFKKYKRCKKDPNSAGFRKMFIEYYIIDKCRQDQQTKAARHASDREYSRLSKTYGERCKQEAFIEVCDTIAKIEEMSTPKVCGETDPKPYDPVHNLCCQGIKHTRQENGVCCGRRLMNPTDNFCCEQKVYSKSSGSCCGSVPYDSKCFECYREKTVKPRFITSTEICCQGQIHTKRPYMQSCCGTQPYNPQEQFCFNDTLSDFINMQGSTTTDYVMLPETAASTKLSTEKMEKDVVSENVKQRPTVASLPSVTLTLNGSDDTLMEGTDVNGTASTRSIKRGVLGEIPESGAVKTAGALDLAEVVGSDLLRSTEDFQEVNNDFDGPTRKDTIDQSSQIGFFILLGVGLFLGIVVLVLIVIIIILARQGKVGKKKEANGSRRPSLPRESMSAVVETENDTTDFNADQAQQILLLNQDDSYLSNVPNGAPPPYSPVQQMTVLKEVQTNLTQPLMAVSPGLADDIPTESGSSLSINLAPRERRPPDGEELSDDEASNQETEVKQDVETTV